MKRVMSWIKSPGTRVLHQHPREPPYFACSHPHQRPHVTLNQHTATGMAGSTTGGSLSHNHSHTFVPTVDRQKHPPQCSHIQGFTLTCTLIRTHSEPYNPHVAPWNRPRGHHLTCTPSTPCPTTGMQAKDSRIHPAAHPGALELLDSLARQTGAFAPRHLHGLRAAARQPSRITPR